MSSKLLILCFVILAFVLQPNSTQAQVGIVDAHSSKKPHLLVLGSYHMANPGRDVAKSEVADVLQPERQAQIEQLVEKLGKFRPTRIAIEVEPDDCAAVQDKFDRYVKGSYQMSRNETEQLGFRLAKAANLKGLSCVDWNDMPPGDFTANYDYDEYAAKDPELKSFLANSRKELQERVTANSQKMLGLSIVDQYIFLNQPAQIDTAHEHYFDYVRIGRGKEYVGANYLSHWYGRNMKIFANLIRMTESPDDRVLVIYGAGHVKLLNQFARESNYYEVESPLKYLGGAR